MLSSKYPMVWPHWSNYCITLFILVLIVSWHSFWVGFRFEVNIYESLFLIKDKDSYIFTSASSHDQMLSRETITKDVNKVMGLVRNVFLINPRLQVIVFELAIFLNYGKTPKILNLLNNLSAIKEWILLLPMLKTYLIKKDNSLSFN